ncbi:glycosyltransferase family 4 protein [Sphingosinicella sp. CPCC 101087]|uniref:glycosyltransferase family 4 protein n=1 Tax=Sphingosinicella sp. CPCC 101087 TaxID=2497754 RepID=UPI00101E084F|nr:glycosyltransferase family 4 protein [Sphingosinicella sp. CPCC 101087]
MTKRLSVLVTTDAVGGVWTYGLDLARGLSRLDIDITLAVLGPSPTPVQQAAARGTGARLVDTRLPLDWVTEDPSALTRAGQRIAELAGEVGADLVQLNSPALAAGISFPVPLAAVMHSCVATWWEAVHGTDLPQDFVWRTGRVAAGLANADKVVTPSAAFGEAVRRCYRLAEAPATVLNGRSPLRLPEAAGHDFCFTAGRLWDAGKNLATLDAAAARIGIPFHAAGPTTGPNGATATFEHLHCLGSIEEAEIGRWLSARPVFASAALYEPFGLAVLEAAMAGCPLVLSDIPTFRELWEDAAVFVPPTDADGFAEAIADLAGDDFARAARGRAAKARAARYTPEAMAARMAEIYRGLVKAERAPKGKSGTMVAAA